MAKPTAFKGLIGVCILLMVGVGSSGAVPPTVPEMLTTYKPKFQDVQLSTPTPEEYAACEVKLVKGARPESSGWLLLDAKKQPMRRFFASGGKKIDSWSYYKDGAEVYREVDSNGDGVADQYRWLNTAGMKWGVSTRQDGKIDAWQMISAEEAGQEVFMALATNDFARLQALFISEADMRAMKLPAAEVQRILGLLKGVSAKFQATRAKLPQLDTKARFVRVETATPNCVPGEANGTGQDQLRFPSRTILFESGDKEKKHDWVQTGEMIQVGMAWRLIDGPSIADSDMNQGAGQVADNPVLRRLFDELTALDAAPPAPLSQPRLDKAVQDYNLKRVVLITKILEQVKGNEQETWVKQIFDNLSAAYQAGDQQALIKLTEQRDHLVKAMPGSDLAAYGTYRHLWASYAEKLIGKNAVKIQEEWLDQLAKFAQAYPKADDTPDALWQLGMGSEYSGKDEEAKRWYQQIYQNFPAHPLALKAKGCEKRLDLIGRDMDLKGPQLGTNAPFDMASLKGKAVVVYFWSSTTDAYVRDFDTLRRLRTAHAKDMELVCINLDDNAKAVTQFLQKAPVAGIHLFEGGGLNSPLTNTFGINGLPHLFLVGKDGRVLNRTLQVGDVEVELRKAL